MKRPSISNDDVVEQAGRTAARYLRQAIDAVCVHLGIDDIDSSHYALVGQLVTAQAHDFSCALIADSIYELSQSCDLAIPVADGLVQISESINGNAHPVAAALHEIADNLNNR